MVEIAETTIQKDTKVRATGWHVLRISIGLLLLISAGTKAHMLATQPTLGEGLLQSRWLQISVVEFELAFSVWLFVGLMSRITSCVALACFTVFTIVSAGKWISGSESCGCFGAVRVFPAWTFLLDLTIIGLLIAFRPRGIVFQWKAFLSEISELRQFKRVGVAVVVWLLLAVPATYAMMSVTKNDLAELGTEFIGADGRKTVLLQPEDWVGKKWPLLPYIEPPEVREKLKNGNWTVVLYHHDCPKCKEVIDDLIEKKTENLVCVEVPPLGTSHMVFPNAVNSSINMKKQIFVETPVVLVLLNSLVHAKETLV